MIYIVNIAFTSPALSSIEGEDYYNSPNKTVGSPHGIKVTRFNRANSRIPQCISCVGITPDPVLNLRIFSSLFAAALAYDGIKSTFVMSGGAILHIDDNDDNKSDKNISNKMLSAAIGPSGPVKLYEKQAKIGVDPEQAMILINDLFTELNNSTGMIHITKGNLDDVTILEDEIISNLKINEKTSKVIRCDHAISGNENTGAIGFIPMFHRIPETDKVEPIIITIPFEILGNKNIFTLLRVQQKITWKI